MLESFRNVQKVGFFGKKVSVCPKCSLKDFRSTKLGKTNASESVLCFEVKTFKSWVFREIGGLS